MVTFQTKIQCKAQKKDYSVEGERALALTFYFGQASGEPFLNYNLCYHPSSAKNASASSVSVDLTVWH